MKQDNDLYESWKYDYTETNEFPNYGGLTVKSPLMVTFVICPKHGKHHHTISSTIPGHEGFWCQLCWLEMLGEPLEAVEEPFEWPKDGE